VGRRRFNRIPRACGCALLLAPIVIGFLAAGPLSVKAQDKGESLLDAAEAKRLLREPGSLDLASQEVIARVKAAYQRLETLKTVSRDGGIESVAYLKRPLQFQMSQKLSISGKRTALVVSDGRDYYEYREHSQRYLQRPARLLNELALPVNVRMFFSGQAASKVLMGLDSTPAVREYRYRYGGKAKINGKPADKLNVSLMVRAPDGFWRSFTSVRFYGADGLLLRAINGGRTMNIENVPNAKIPANQFRWVPPAGAVQGFG
jgi:hypothetical protein